MVATEGLLVQRELAQQHSQEEVEPIQMWVADQLLRGRVEPQVSLEHLAKADRVVLPVPQRMALVGAGDGMGVVAPTNQGQAAGRVILPAALPRLQQAAMQELGRPQ